MNNMEMPVEIRTGVAEDVPLILNSWMKAHRESDECKFLDYTLYHKMFRPILVNILSRSSVIVAHNPEDVNHIYGYAVVEYVDTDTVLHYCYSKYTFRRFGVCRQLLEFAIPTVGQTPTFLTFAGKSFPIMQEKFHLVYNPWMR